MERIISFTDQFCIFSDHFNCADEFRKFEAWIDFRQIQSIVQYAPGLSIPFDRGFFTKSRSASDQLLNLVCRYYDQKELCGEVDQILKKLEPSSMDLLYARFYEDQKWDELAREHSNPYLYEDLLVAFAAANDDYMFQDMIRSEYESLKSKHQFLIKEALKEVNESFDEKIRTLGDRFDIAWCEKDHSSNAYKRKKRIFLYVILYFEGKLDRDDLNRFLPLHVGGRKILKQL